MGQAKSTSRDDFAKSGRFSYQIAGFEPADLDAAEVVSSLPEWAISALHFALKTAARNATAGLMDDKLEEASKRVAARIAAWQAGSWQAASERSGEPHETILVRAVAEYYASQGVEVTLAEVAKEISEAVTEALEKAGVDPESEESKEAAQARKIARAVRDDLRDSKEILPIYTRMQKEELDKRAEVKATKATSVSALLQR
jgi:hypothetical protein